MQTACSWPRFPRLDLLMVRKTEGAFLEAYEAVRDDTVDVDGNGLTLQSEVKSRWLFSGGNIGVRFRSTTNHTNSEDHAIFPSGNCHVENIRANPKADARLLKKRSKKDEWLVSGSMIQNEVVFTLLRGSSQSFSFHFWRAYRAYFTNGYS